MAATAFVLYMLLHGECAAGAVSMVTGSLLKVTGQQYHLWVDGLVDLCPATCQGNKEVTLVADL